MHCRAWLLTILILTTTAASAGPPDKVTQIGNNFSHENAICGAYYGIVAQCLEPKDPAVAQNYRANGITFAERSVKIGRASGVSADALIARGQMAREGLESEIEGSCTNISVLLRQYAKACKGLLENGPQSLQRRLDEALTR